MIIERVKTTEHASGRNGNQMQVLWLGSLCSPRYAAMPGETTRAFVWHLQAYSAGGNEKRVLGYKFRLLTSQTEVLLYYMSLETTILTHAQCRIF